MPDFVTVAKTSDLASGEAKAVSVRGREIALFNLDGTFYALDNFCPHQGGPLAEGYIEGNTVTCPWHAWCFDIRTGKMSIGDLGLIDTFEVQLEGENVNLNPEPRHP